MSEQALFGLDTNILVYLSGNAVDVRALRADEMLRRLGPERFMLPAQVLGEFYNVSVRKIGRSPQETSELVYDWSSRIATAPANLDTYMDALTLASRHNLQFWDALILATSANAGCVLLLTEDLQDGFVWKGCTVANPFAEPMHPLLKDALERG